MKRGIRKVTLVALTASLIATGCQPTQPFYFGGDGSLSRYIGKATQIETPDVANVPNAEVTQSRPPLTLENANFDQTWPLSLQQAVKDALANGKVLRSLGGRFATEGSATAPQTGEAPNALLTNPDGNITIYDPAIQESSSGFGGLPIGVEAALSAFDADFTAGMTWSHNNLPLNEQDPTFLTPMPILQKQDLGTFQAQLAKTTAEGTRVYVGSEIDYNNTVGVPAPFGPAINSSWTSAFTAGFNQPLLQGFGADYNRIAGPYNPQLGLGTRQFDGVLLARINTDITLADFEAGVRNLVLDVENAYWELYFAYRNLESSKVALTSSLKTWQRVKVLGDAGLPGGAAKDEALAREQYYGFKSQLQEAKSNLFTAESRLRYIMGLSVSDGRLIRPCDEPTSAKVTFNWCEVLAEAMERSVELRKQKWRIKQHELELIAAKNHLLPRLDASGLYKWQGLGHGLIDSNPNGNAPFDNAFQTMLDGDYQEWQVGLNLIIKLGFRQELADVRDHQLMVTRAKAVLEEQELELSHQLADSIRSLDQFHAIAETNFNHRMAAQHEVNSLLAIFNSGVDTSTGGTYILDLLLQAQQRLAASESAYYRSLVDYNRAIAQLHLRKGSLLEYNGVYLTEGPWPAKAYFDALRLARQRDASTYMNYGFTRPKVSSRGPYEQFGGNAHGDESATVPMGSPDQAAPEEVPAPQPENSNEKQATRRSPRLSANDGSGPQFDWGPLGLKRASATTAAVQPVADWQGGSTTTDEPVANNSSR